MNEIRGLFTLAPEGKFKLDNLLANWNNSNANLLLVEIGSLGLDESPGQTIKAPILDEGWG